MWLWYLKFSIVSISINKKEKLILPFLAITLKHQVKGLKKQKGSSSSRFSHHRISWSTRKKGKKKERPSTFSTFYHRFRKQKEAARRWIRECELSSFHTYPEQTQADCQGSDTSLNGQPITAVKNLHLQLSSCFVSELHTRIAHTLYQMTTHLETSHLEKLDKA